MASGNFSSRSVNGLSLYVAWSSTDNISANTSSVTAKVYVKSYGLRGSALSDSYITINGNKKNWAYSFNIDNTSVLQTTKVTEYTVTVPHNSDGTKSITIKANMEFNGTYGGTYVSDLTASKSVTLGTIPRSSALSIPSSVNTGSSLTSTITPSSSTFKHKIRFEIDGSSKYTSGWIAKGTTSFAYTIPHSWLPKTTSTKMKVFLYTYLDSANNDSDYIARIYKEITVNVPSSIKPTVSSVSTTLVSGLNNKYVQGKSKIKLVASASAGSGSSISSYVFKGANISGSSGTYNSTSNTRTSSTIQTSGAVQYKVAAKDARGRISDYKTVSVNVYEYAAPQINSISAQRCNASGVLDNNGTYAKIVIKTSYTSVDGANTRTVKLCSSKDDYASTITVLDTDNTSNTYTGVYNGDFATSSSYTVKAIIQDSYNTNNKSIVLGVSERTINIAKYGNGVAIGGLSTVVDSTASGLFECNWQTHFKEGVNIDNSTQEYVTVTRRSVSDDINQDGTNETADIRVQLYVNGSGNVTCRRRYSVDNSAFTTQGYWQLRDSDFYVNENIVSYKELFTNGKTDAYDGKQGACISNNGRVYLVGTTEGKTGAISPYKPGIVFAYDNATNGTSSILETASGVLTFDCTANVTGNVATDGKFGSTSTYNDLVFAMYCQWKDNANHDIINRDIDGLTAGIGWAGSSSYSTVLNLRGQTVRAPNNSGVAVTSDERLKNSFIDLNQYESFFDKLHPVAFKYNDGASGRYHIGFGAQSVENALTESGLDNTKFGGILRYPVKEDSGDYRGYSEEYGLIYNEFIALNTHMIQKLKQENEALKQTMYELENKLNYVLSEIKGE